MVVAAREKLLIREIHTQNPVFVPSQLVQARLSLDVPDADRSVVASRNEPLQLWGLAILLVSNVVGHRENPALVTFEAADLARGQVVAPNHRVDPRNEEPLIEQVQALDSFTACDKRPIHLRVFEVDCADDLVPRTRKQQVVLLVHADAGYRVLKLEDLHAAGFVGGPLAHCAVLGGTEQMASLEDQTVDLVHVTDECFKTSRRFFGFVERKLVVQDKPVVEPAEELYDARSSEAECAHVLVLSNLLQGFGCVQTVALRVVH